jgi:hypothetical protein
MKKTALSLILAVFAAPLLSLAQDAARPDVEEMLATMRIEKTMQAAMSQVKKMVPQMAAQMAGGSLSAEDASKVAAMQQKIVGLVEKEMSWPNIKPEIVKIYSETLTPQEVKGITAFYKSPAGQAFLDKQPAIMEKTMQWQQKMMAGLMPKIQELVKSEIEAAGQK